MEGISDFDRGVLVGVLIGEGHFGGDGKQAHVTVRMHTRHEALFHWLVDVVPGSKLYGPYHHGGRSYFQWMARGPVLARDLLPLLEESIDPRLDGHAASRLAGMTERYADQLARARTQGAPPSG